MPASSFWADYAAHDGTTPFLSPHFIEATRSFTETMLALAVLDLPFDAGRHAESRDGGQVTLTAASPLVLFHREIRPAARAEQPGTVLVAQRFFRADDRHRDAGDEGDGASVTAEFLPHVAYGARVVLTNPTDARQTLDALLQIPTGAVPLNGSSCTRGVSVTVEPRASQTLEYFFAFPAPGTFAHYPVTVAEGERVVAVAPPVTFAVVPRLTRADTTSWPWVAEHGTCDEVLAFLARANLRRLDLAAIAWRMRDVATYRRVTALLASRHVYDDTLWAYALEHDDAPGLAAWLSHSSFADRCGPHLVSPLLVLDPVERCDYQHLEYAPLVNPRAHPLAGKRTVLDERLREQYRRLLHVLCHKPELNDADALAVSHSLVLQDRVAEALDWRARVDAEAVAERLQCAYLDVYLAFSRGDTATARQIAARHAAEPVERWRRRFVQALAQLDEIEGRPSAVAAGRDASQAALAAAAPALELEVEAGRIRIDYRNLDACVLNFHPLDIELLFSRDPFMTAGQAPVAFVRPAASRTVALPAGADTLTVDLPAEFRNRDVMVEAVAAGVRKSRASCASGLKVQVIEAYGQLVATDAATRRPAAGAYVKVYARSRDGEVAFVQDGYTDLRGRFDYASLQGGPLEDAERLALLVLGPESGAVVREAAPPAR